MIHQLFVYGTLRRAALRRRVFGRAVALRAAQLHRWRRVLRVVQGRYHGLVRDARARVDGGVLAITPAELRRADAFEAVPRLYVRRRVQVRVGGHARRAWVYLPSAPQRRR